MLAGLAEAQLGHVVKAQKINTTTGGFTAQLDEMDQFGRSIVNLGDLDSDGVTDLLVAAHTDDDGGLDKGSVYVLFLKANGLVKAWQKISDLEGNFAGQLRKGDQFGRAAANLGDLDGDGVTDVAVSANYDDDGGTNKGAVYILFLNTDGTVKAFQKISSTQGGLPAPLSIHDEFGRSITALGDMDGDGLTELLVGTPEDDEGGTNTGALHVLFLNANGTVKAYRRISKFSSGIAIKPGDWFGFCSTNLGDFDGDGVVDVAVGAVLDDDGGTNQGSVWILCLNSDGSVKTAREIDELEGNFGALLDDIDQFGTSVSTLGDLDGDGVTDIAVGAVKDDDGGPQNNPDADVGAVYVLFLNADATVKSFVKISDLVGNLPYPLDQGDWFGSALARLGGSPLDGLYNVAIGCRNDDDAANGSNQGAIYLVQLNDGTAPAASFEASQTLGVAPLTVSFTDTSAGIVTGWVWNLGSGAQSTLQHPTRTYATPGAYDVQLTARGPTGTDTELRRQLVTVVAGPLAAFGASPRSGPCPLTVAFADQSLGSVTSWSWAFGDGTTSTEPAPLHTYAECGSYTVTLTVSGPEGTNTLTQVDYVVAALEAPVAAFARTPASGPGPLSVQFSDLSTGEVTAWSWDFGDGTGSNAASPVHEYQAEGSYTVALTVTGPGGTSTHSEPGAVVVTVPAPSAYFDATPTLGPQPLAVVFSDLTTGSASTWSWDFGDGQGSDERNPVHVYTEPGVYDVTLSASGPGGNDVRTRAALVTVEAAPPGAAFRASPTSGSAPLAVQFNDLSTFGVTAWAWDFGDGGSASVRDPQHVYDQPGTYTVTLAVDGPGGSDDLTLVDLITVSVPATVADFTADVTSGTVPLTVSFQDASTPNATSWSWDFGDGTGSLERDPVHTYLAAGLYDVSLAVTSPTGADLRGRPAFVEVLEPAPVAAFTGTPETGFAPLLVQFTDESQGPVSAWSWDFGDGTSSRDPSPAHPYAQPGLYSVTLTVTGSGGTDTLVRSAYVQVEDPAPQAAFSAIPTSGLAPHAVQFSDASSGLVTSWSWSFGDGGSSTEASPEHVYATPGVFDVTLTVTGPAGGDAETRLGLVTVTSPLPLAGFSGSPTSGTAPLAVQFTDASSGTITSRTWDFGDGTGSSEPSPAHTYTAAGTYAVTLTVSGPNGSDGETKVGYVTVTQAAPVAGFTGTPTSGVAPLAVQFTDASSGPLTSWSWDFGDGTGSGAASPAHVYTTPGTYTVTLMATGPGGSDGETKVGYVTVAHPAPVAGFTGTPTSGVAPLAVQFTDASSGTLTSWSWDFGDGTGSGAASPAHVYTIPGTYSVRLAVSGPGGSSEALATDLVTVLHAAPVADFAASPREGYAPLQVAFSDASTGTVSAWAWDFGDGQVSTEPSPLHLFELPGSYSVRLVVSGPGGTSERRRAIVAREAPLFADGGFEAQLAGLAPLVPWTVYNGTAVRVRSSTTSDQGFPSEGLNWLEIGAEGTSNARPPANPFGAGTPATGTAGVQQDFRFPADTHLVFDAAFLLGGTQDSTNRNDFLSVDLTDGVTSWNLYYADSFSEFVQTSPLGLPMTAPERVHVDLSRLFPDALPTTVLSLRASVGNVGGSGTHSRAWVDGFHFGLTAKASYRNGRGINPPFYTANAPVVGTSWGVEVDSSALPGAVQVLVLGHVRPLGGLRVARAGEVLVGGERLFSLSFPCAGGRERHAVPIPADHALVGRRITTQAVLVGRTFLLGNAYDLVVGY
ncbi:MAG TPA: PKD domain-containing protein [Planctomycetota bacterium]